MALPDLPRFYCPQFSTLASADLDEDEFKHAKVLRLNTGDAVHVVDGLGNLFLATVEMGKKRGSITKVELVQNEPAPSRRIAIAVAPTKNIARMEWLIEKATEIGMTDFIPVHCEHSERVHLRLDRLSKIALSAMKQSKSLHLPVIHPTTAFIECLALDFSQKLIAHCHDGLGRMDIRSKNQKPRTMVLIGPEGDFSEAEIQLALQSGCEPISLGEKRLRTETAALVACVLLAASDRL